MSPICYPNNYNDTHDLSINKIRVGLNLTEDEPAAINIFSQFILLKHK